MGTAGCRVLDEQGDLDPVSDAARTTGFPASAHLLGQPAAALVLAGHAAAVLLIGAVMLRRCAIIA
jgi:hypothetical protein